MGSQFKNSRNILIVMLGGIGNLILLTPALRALRNHFSKSKITLLAGEPSVDDIISADNLIDALIFFDKNKSNNFFDIFHFIKAMRNEHFDLVLVASSTNVLNASLATFLMAIPQRIGENIGGKGFFYTHKIPFDKKTHELDGMINLVNFIGCDVKDTLPKISLFDEDKEMAGKFLAKSGLKKGERLIGIHTGCGEKQIFKRWHKERFAKVADELIKKYGVKVLFTGGEKEIDLVKDVMGLMKEHAINASGQLTIRQTAAVIKQCQLFISNDSGLAHIAAAVDTPLIVLFGNTEIWRIAPRGKSVHIIQKYTEQKNINPLYLILEEDVLQIAEKILNEN